MTIYVTTSDGQIHKYAGLHRLDMFRQYVRDGGEDGWVRVANGSSRTGFVQIVTIAEADQNDSITAPDTFYKPD